MKATVVQIEGKYAVLLQKNGTFIKMKSMNLKIGDVVDKKVMNVCKKRRFGSMIAAALFVVLMGGGVYTYGSPSYYVSLDVNPGITMEVNRFERVISLVAANDDAEEVLDGLDLENKDIEDAVFLAVERITDLGYFDEEGGNILISAMAEEDEKATRVAEQLQVAVMEELEENGTNAEVISKVIGYEMVQAAREFEGMTPGKYNIIVNILGAEPENVEKYADQSIQDILRAVKASRGLSEPEEHEDPSIEEKSPKQVKKSLDKADRKEKKAADKAEFKESKIPMDKVESESNSINSDKKNTDKISEKKLEPEKEVKKEPLDNQANEPERKIPEGTDHQGKPVIPVEPEKEEKKESLDKQVNEPEKKIPEGSDNQGKPENPEETENQEEPGISEKPETEEKREPLDKQINEQERKYPEGTDHQEEAGISEEPDKELKSEIPVVPERANKPEAIEERGKPEIPTGRRP